MLPNLLQLLLTFSMIFEHLPDSSRVWIYTANRSLSEQKGAIDQKLKAFVSQWAAHGSQLFGDAAVLNDYFIVLAVDESRAGASGCSIDSSVGFLRLLAKELEVDLFDRMNMIIQSDGENSLVRFHDLSSLGEVLIFDPLISNLGELRKNWLKPISTTPYA